MLTDPVGAEPFTVPAIGQRAGRWTVPDDGLVSRSARARGSGPYEAAVPARLADVAIALPGDLAADLADAEAALVRLDAHAAAALGPEHTAIGPMSSILLRTESSSSSQIEDLTVGARQLALAELDEATSANARLVMANVRTMEAALALAEHLDAPTIQRMHRVLLGDRDPSAGTVRTQLVWVGTSSVSPLGAAHIAPEPDDVPPAINDLTAFMAREDLPVLLHAALAHAQFETIHPFTDGNGRTGRALVHAITRGKGLTVRTTAPISAGLLTDVETYTAALTAFRAGDARPIAETFAQAARYASVTGIRLVDDLAAELEESRRRLGSLRPQSRAWALLPHLVAQPIVNAAHVKRVLTTSDMTAQRALGQLADAGVLVETTGRSRGRVWQHPGILAVLDAYAETVRRGRSV